MNVAPGTLLGGRYEVLKRIATGGMATVHLARAVGAGGFERLVAIKMMHPQFAAEPEFVTMFLDEARLAARIRHPNVVPTLDIQETPEGLFLVMEFIDGPSLGHLRKVAGPAPLGVPLGVSLRILVDTLTGLHAAHELADDEGKPLALIHRDVSPVNILVGVDGIARITDFGVARAEARLSSTRGGQLKGKLPYMPPEQLMNEPLDRRTDVFAAGAVAWEVLIGRRLFVADSEGALLTKILKGAEASPRQVHADIPESVDRVVMKALSPARDDRFPTAAAFAEALEIAAEDARVTIASARAVAAFIESSGAHQRVDPKEIAQLKKAGAEAPRAATSQPGVAASADKAVLPPPELSSSPSAVTSADVAVSARPREAPRSSRAAIAIVGAVAIVGGAIGGLLFLRSGAGDASPSPSAADARTTTPATDSKPAVTVVAPTSTATSEPSTSATASASAPTVAGKSTPDRHPTPAQTVKPPTTKETATAPVKTAKPPPTAYEPDRL